MLNKLKYATISDIFISNLRTYNGGNGQELLNLCNQFNFSYVPGEDRESIFKIEGDQLKLIELNENMICRPNDLIFHRDAIIRFKNSGTDGLLFVMDQDKIVGVVHFIDYNTEFVYVELFKAFFRFEGVLRNLLIENGLCDEVYHLFLDEKSKNDESESQREHYLRLYKTHIPDSENARIKKEKRRNDFGPFQTLLFSELLDYGNSIKIWPKQVRSATHDLKELRNWVAHYKDIGSKRGINKESIADEDVHDLSSLEEFVEKMNSFVRAYESLR
jgi:hypothetical protein